MFSIVLLSCSRAEKQQPVYIHDYYKKHFSYAVGTWWVFTDVSNGGSDSFVVVHNYHKTPYMYDDNKQESNNMRVLQYSTGTTGVSKTEWNIEIIAPHYLTINLEANQYSYSQTLLSGVPPQIKEDVRYKAKYGLYTRYHAQVVTNVTLGNRTWHSLYKITNHYDSSNTDKVRYYNTWYISPDSGIVALYRSDNVANEELQLSRCNIVY